MMSTSEMNHNDIISPLYSHILIPKTKNRTNLLEFISTRSSVYKLEAVHNKTLNPTSLLVKLHETSPGKMRVLDLFSNDRLCFLPENFPGKIDLQEFHVRLIRRAYRIEYSNNGGGEISSYWSLNSDKVVILSSGEDSALMAIHSGGKLGFLKKGNEERWRILDDSWNVIYEDIMVYKENCIVVDDKGRTVIYDVGFRVSDLAGGLAGGGGHKKHLVEYSGGEVLLVDKYVKHVWYKSEFSKSAVEFRIPAGDLVGGCIFYRDCRNGGRSRGLCSDGDGVFNVEYSTHGDFVFPVKPKCLSP
ncbi:unnamed protein product [Arabis nemorensis]|uniref:KIB1-4 beta-propeller domain-containing protein n=1 Tax=Arabis nemorensis TaxID=586526 RepID=A0A565CSJ4_9BRAS|nr:unnamed protein product [Arabis nemorensis]